MKRGGISPSRRDAAKLLAAGIVGVALMGHTPYGQWTIYRKRNLFIVAARRDEQATALARAVAEGLAAELPSSRARFTRANGPVRVASLLKSGQLQVAVIGRDEAEPMLRGGASFAAVGPVPLRLLADYGEHLLVTVEDFKARHAFLIAQALDQIGEQAALPVQAAAHGMILPPHAGALAYRSGGPLPADEGGSDMEPQHPHPHPH